MSHVANPDLLNRLRRANGHLTGIIRMVEEGGDGLKIAQQMQAVVATLEKTKTLIVTDHIASPEGAARPRARHRPHGPRGWASSRDI